MYVCMYHDLDPLFENEWLCFADEYKIDESESIWSDAAYIRMYVYIYIYRILLNNCTKIDQL